MDIKTEFSLETKYFDKNNIFLSNTDLEKITKKVFDIDTLVEKDVQANISPLKQISLEYINNLQKILSQIQVLLSKYEHYNKILESQVGKEDSYYSQELAKIKQNNSLQLDFKKIYEKLIKETDNYTKKVQEKLDLNYQIIYVYQGRTGKEVEVYKVDIQDLIKIRSYNSKSAQGKKIDARLYASKKELKSLGNDNLIKKEDYTIGLEQAKLLDKVYQEVIRRYHIRKKKPYLILWNVGTETSHVWNLMFLYQKGDLAQAYANFVLKQDNSVFKGNVNMPPETDIETFMEVVEKINSTFGGLQGDITDKKNNVTYAIKSLKSSPQGILKTIDMARDIMNGNFDKQQFMKYKEKNMAKKGRNTIQRRGNREIQEDLKDVFDKM